MKYNHAIYCQQVGLKSLGFNPGALDGMDGPKTRSAYKKSLNQRFGKGRSAITPSSGLTPPPKPNSKVKTLGPHGVKDGKAPKMSYVSIPWKMHLYNESGKVVNLISCHHIVAKPLQLFVNDLYKKLGKEGIRKYGFHLWFGCYVPRKTRGGSHMSDHAWAAAIDWNANGNKNYQSWVPGKAMPNGTHQFTKAIVALANKYGFQVGFKYGNTRRDMMHFAYIDRP